jgi:hypothetical protein
MLGVIDLAAAFFKALLAPIALTDGNKTGVQCLGGGVPANFLVNVGAGGGSATITIEESDDNSTYTALKDLSGNNLSFALVAGDANSALLKTGFRTKKYVRAVVASTSGTIVAGVTLIEGNVYANPAGYEAGVQTDYDAS